MTESPTDRPTPRRTLRLWPGIALVAVQWTLWLGLELVVPSSTAGMIAVMGGMLAGVLVLLWWVLSSRAPWSERLGGAALLVAALLATRWILHPSVATGGMGFLFFAYAIPPLSLAFVVWAVATRNLTGGRRWATLAATILLACGAWGLVRMDGVSADGTQFAWRWAPTAEERLLARGAAARGEVTPAAPATLAEVEEAAWPGFRGPGRDGDAPGVRIAIDWEVSPPVELWRRPVGPGWSSFAVLGDLVFTQEQRGEDEIVACYRATTGEPVWRHADTTRFWEANAGAGPRATPTLHGGRVYALGATGILNVLEAADGTEVWNRDVAADTGVEVPYWGFAGSPLVVGDQVVAAAAGRLAAYDRTTGELRWMGPDGGTGYSSPQRLTLDGVEQLLLVGGSGAVAVASDDGRLLWEHGMEGLPIVQPALGPGGDVLVGSETGGLTRLAVSRGAGGWTATPRWTTNRLKPYFNDFVVHRGHAYGFDGSLLAAVDLETGERRWKGGRYGQGQLLLLPDQDLLLVITERGELALVAARPEGFEELARRPALEGKTWNHPVVVGDLLLVRNDREMAAFRLAGG